MTITIPDTLFIRLQKHAKPFPENPAFEENKAAIIERILDFYEEHLPRPHEGNASPRQATEPPTAVRKLDPLQPPSLLHTRVRGQFGNTHFSNWNDMLQVAHAEAFNHTGRSFEKLQAMTSAQIKNGPYIKHGFHPVPGIGLSIQGVDADRAWAHSLRLARRLQLPIHAEVEWRQNPKAAYPGDRATIAWSPQ